MNVARRLGAFLARSGAALLASWALASCAPLGLEGDARVNAPCAAGLVCEEGLCVVLEVEPPPPPPCEADGDCVLRGSADGRVCEEGVCAFDTCVIDATCGVRICDEGFCADAVPCNDGSDCADGQQCQDDVCRTPCQGDGDCPGLGGLSIAACVEGECRQRCLFDGMCLGGGLCDANLCRDPDCQGDLDCLDFGPGEHFCDAGRCTQFTPCGEDADCFDDNFFCNELGRCTERPLCNGDSDCDVNALCSDGHCQENPVCDDDGGCPGDRECVASRCVGAPLCRTDDDCEAGLVCDAARCEAVSEDGGDATFLAVQTPHGVCSAAAGVLVGSGACAVVLFPDETLTVSAQAYDDTGAPLYAALAATGDDVDVLIDGATAALLPQAPGRHEVQLAVGAVIVPLTITVLPPRAQPLRVLVVDEAGVAVVAGRVFAGALDVALDASGTASLDAGAARGALGVRTADGARGLAYADAPLQGDVRLRFDDEQSVDAGAPVEATVTVSSSGDELGAIALRFVVPAAPRLLDVTVARLLGPPVDVAVTLPVVGALPVTLPAGVSIAAAVPVVGNLDVKTTATALLPGSPSAFLAFEEVRDQGELLGLVQNDTLALDLAAGADGADAALVHTAAGAAFSESVTPVRNPAGRVEVEVGAEPLEARALVAAFSLLPGAGAVPLGVAATTGGTSQLRALPPGAALGRHDVGVVVRAASEDDDVVSAAFVRGRGLPLRAPLSLLPPPAGAFVLDDVPAAGRQLVVVPGGAPATTVRVRLTDGDGVAWTVVAAAGANDASVALPSFVRAEATVSAELLRLPGATAEAATDATLLEAPGLPLVERALAVARAPAR